MEALNALGLKPICVLPDQRAKPNKNFQIQALPTIQFPLISSKNNTPHNISKLFHESIVLIATTFSAAKYAAAITYEEVIEQSVNTNSAADFDAGSVVETIINNPIIVAGSVAVIAVPLVVSQIFSSKPKPFGVESAKSAYTKLGDDPNAQLLDIRPLKELREVGSPDVRGLKKKPVSVVYRGDDKPGFLQKLSLKFKDPGNTTLYILDKYDGNSELVAELVTANGFKSAFAVKDGAEGPRGWMNSSLPWLLPKESFSLDFGSFTDALEENLDAFSVLGIGVAAGLGLLAFTEMETVLQVLGSAAIIQFVSKKLLFEEDRKQTLRQLDEFVNYQIAPKDLVSDIKQIGTAILPVTVSKALPAPAESPVAEDSIQKTETLLESQAEAPVEAPTEAPTAKDSISKAETISESSTEAPAQPTPEINSTTQNEVEAVSNSRPLSPYPAYPDLKPPTSPSPSQP